MTDIVNHSLQGFLDELASKQATPGGGSVAALLGAQAAALVSMVCNLTLGKVKYAAVTEDMQVLLRDAEQLRADLTAMITEDVAVFNQLMACYALAKTTDAEKQHRAEQIQLALTQATEAPLKCVTACYHALQLAYIAAEKGNLGAISDAGVAAVAALAGLKSAALNVKINATALNDREYADAKLAEIQNFLNLGELQAEKTYQLVNSKLQ